MVTENAAGARRLGPWLWILCGLLLGWTPVSFALFASTLVDSLPVRGAATSGVLAFRLVVVAIGIAAGLSLLGRRPGAVLLAKVALIASLAADLLVDFTSWLPSNRLPGTTWIYVAATLTYHLAWLTYLFSSKRVRSLS